MPARTRRHLFSPSMLPTRLVPWQLTIGIPGRLRQEIRTKNQDLSAQMRRRGMSTGHGRHFRRSASDEPSIPPETLRVVVDACCGGLGLLTTAASGCAWFAHVGRVSLGHHVPALHPSNPRHSHLHTMHAYRPQLAYSCVVSVSRVSSLATNGRLHSLSYPYKSCSSQHNMHASGLTSEELHLHVCRITRDGLI
jgi:hypothetical protein